MTVSLIGGLMLRREVRDSKFARQIAAKFDARGTSAEA
jgi:hypothetical protein